MKKIGILTINGNHNYGNRLQNYALKIFVENIGVNVENIWFRATYSEVIKDKIKKILIFMRKFKRYEKFSSFTDKYLNVKYYYSPTNVNYEKIIVGSDQVWNYNFPTYSDKMLLSFSKNRNNNISYSASFGIDKVDAKHKVEFINGLNNFNYLSVREDRGKEIVEELTNRKDVEVLVDPTMLLTAEEWDKVTTKPKQLNNKKYILNYFLGNLSENKKSEIERIAKENDCIIINLLDENSPFYECGPSEFLYLEKNAFLICTDSFHSSVFAILYNRPFIVFDRDDETVNMNSRIETLLSKFKLEDRKFNGTITNDLLKHDYAETYKILEEERKKSLNFLKNALDIE